MTRRIKPPASPALSLLRAKAARERIKLAQEQRQEAKHLAHAGKVRAQAVQAARSLAAAEAERRAEAAEERAAARSQAREAAAREAKLR